MKRLSLSEVARRGGWTFQRLRYHIVVKKLILDLRPEGVPAAEAEKALQYMKDHEERSALAREIRASGKLGVFPHN